MGKTYRRNESFKPKGKNFNTFKRSNKFKKWHDRPTHSLKPADEIKNTITPED